MFLFQNGQTALMIASMKGHLEVVKALTQSSCALDMETEVNKLANPVLVSDLFFCILLCCKG